MFKLSQKVLASTYVRGFSTVAAKKPFESAYLKQLGFTNNNMLRNSSVAEIYDIGYQKLVPVDPNTKGTTVSSTGALVAYSGVKTGRSPTDKRIVGPLINNI